MNKNKRPIIKLPFSPVEKIFEALAALGIVVSVFLIANYWSALPDQVPSHFGITGEPDSWSGKSILIILPAISLFIYTLLTVVSRIPQHCNYIVTITEENAERQYRMARQFIAILKTEIIWIFTLINWAAIGIALERCESLGIMFLPIFLVIVFGTVGIYIYKSVKAK